MSKDSNEVSPKDLHFSKGWITSRPVERIQSTDGTKLLGLRGATLSLSRDASQNQDKKHRFLFKVFTSPIFCKFCNGFIWGVGRSGYVCSECNFSVHRECLASAAETICANEKTEQGEEESILESQLSKIQMSSRVSGNFQKQSNSVTEQLYNNEQLELQIKLENLFVENHRTLMKYQFAQNELEQFLQEKPKLEENIKSLASTQRELIANIEKLLSSCADKETDLANTVQLTNQIKAILSESKEAYELLVGKVQELKFLYNAINPPSGKLPQKLEPKTIIQVTAAIESLETLMEQLENSAVKCKELIFYNSKLLSTRANELQRHNENLQEQLNQLKDLNSNVMSAREEIKNLGTHLDTTQNKFQQLKESLNSTELVDPETNHLPTKIERIVRSLSGCHLLLGSRVDIIKRTQSSIELSRNRENTKEPDSLSSSEDVVYLENETQNGLPIIKAATIDKLIERLTYHSNSDVDFQKNFLLTYKTFMTTRELFEKLILRYCITPLPTQQTKERVVSIKQNYQIPVRLRVLNVIKSLIDHNHREFDSDPALMNNFTSFMEVVKSTGLQKIASQLKLLIEKKTTKEKQTQVIFAKQPPDSVVPSDPWYTLMDVEPIELARQITLLGFEKFKLIQPEELLNLSWSKKDKETKAPNLLVMIRLYNKISNWVSSEILKAPDIQKKAARITKFLQVAQECKKLFNYNGVFEILGGLGHAAVYRLKQSWALVPKEYLAFYDQISQLTKNNYKQFREEIQNANTPCLPYLGVYLTDLTFLEEMGPNVLHNGSVNFLKLQKVAETVRKIQQYQQGVYCLKVVDYIRDDLLEFNEMNDNEAWILSLKAEPRQTPSVSTDQVAKK